MAYDVPGYEIFEKNGPYCDGLIGQDLRPVLREGSPVFWILGRESSHIISLRIQLLLKENG